MQSEIRRVVADGVEAYASAKDGHLRLADGRTFAEEDVVHLPPSVPSKIICTHLNYRSRMEEMGRGHPSAPTYFHKPTSCLNGHLGQVVRPRGCRYLNHEGEFALVIGRAARGVTPEEAPAHILGFTIANDYGLHDFRDTDQGSMLRVKGSDTLGAVGPGLVTGWDFRSKRITTRVNGRVVQDGSTDELLWDPHYLVADLARLVTLLPGDLVLTGTPANSRPVEPGDVVTVTVEGLGALTNTIVEGPLPVAQGFGAQPTSTDAVLGVAFGSDHRAGTRR